MVALIEFGEHISYCSALYKLDPLAFEGMTIYYYPEDITLEEAKVEIADLKEFYDEVKICEPVPKHLEELLNGNQFNPRK